MVGNGRAAEEREGVKNKGRKGTEGTGRREMEGKGRVQGGRG